MGDGRARPVVANWSGIESELVRPGVTRKAFGTDQVLLVMNEIEPVMQPGPHSHEGFDQIACIISGEAVYHVGEASHRVGPGSLLLIPAGVTHWIEPVGDEVVENLDVFAPARADLAHLIDWMKAAPGTPAGSP
ncbi:MAG TPA: cupin domain-containing protein [Acidimicrobiales bacterium]|nr:cupin domain-containing protein [Acidimicrobiales bacterium]